MAQLRSQRAVAAHSPDQIASEQAAFMNKVYLIMAGGLAATAATAAAVASSDAAISLFLGNRMVFYGLLFLELVMVWTFVSIAQRVSALGAGALFMSYAVVNGLTMSIVFVIYTKASIAMTFVVTAGTFAVMSAYGYFTKRDLSSWGSFLLMGLVGIIIASIVNFFLQSPALYWFLTFAGILVFVGLTAYDTKKIKELNIIGNAGTDEDHKEAIHGALVLYLDFINLFLYLLRLFGKRR